jgi:hypothetical protein
MRSWDSVRPPASLRRSARAAGSIRTESGTRKVTFVVTAAPPGSDPPVPSSRRGARADPDDGPVDSRMAAGMAERRSVRNGGRTAMARLDPAMDSEWRLDGHWWAGPLSGRTATGGRTPIAAGRPWRPNSNGAGRMHGGRTRLSVRQRVAAGRQWWPGQLHGGRARLSVGQRLAAGRPWRQGSCMAAGRACRSDSDWRPDGHGCRTAIEAGPLHGGRTRV